MNIYYITYYYLIFSRAILCYLVNKYGSSCPEKCKLYPTEPEMRANVDRLLYFDTGTLYKNIVDYFVSYFHFLLFGLAKARLKLSQR
jgi:glutathione S-transferase